MNELRELAEQVRRIADENMQQLETLLDMARTTQRPAVAAAKCANEISKLRTKLEGIEERFRELERGDGDEARVG